MRTDSPIGRAVSTYCPDWTLTQLDVRGVASVNAEILGHDTAPEFTFRYIDIGSVNTGIIDWDAVEVLRFADAPSRARRVVRYGDTLICTVRPLLKSHAFADWTKNEPTVCSTGFAVARCDERLVPAFLKHLPFSDQVARQLVAWQCGTNYPAVNERDVRRIVIPLPATDEQDAIALLLDTVDRSIESVRHAGKTADGTSLALAQQLFSEGLRGERQKQTALGLIPRSWEAVPVSAVVTSFQYGLSVPMQSSGQTPILRMGNIQRGDVDLSDAKYVTLAPAIVAPYMLHRGDVLFNRTNSQEWVGKVGIYRRDDEAVFASYLIRLLPDATRVDPYYLGHVLNSYQAQCRIKRYATPGVQQVNVNATNLGKVLIPVPQGSDSLEEQREIGTILEAANELARSYQPVLAAHEALKRTLMNDLLSGNTQLVGRATAVAS